MALSDQIRQDTNMRTAEQVIHDSLQEWNTDEFVQMDWNNRAAAAIIKALNEAGYIVSPASMFSVERAPSVSRSCVVNAWQN